MKTNSEDKLNALYNKATAQVRERIEANADLFLSMMDCCSMVSRCEQQWMRDALYEGYARHFSDRFADIEIPMLAIPEVLEDFWMEGYGD